MTTHCHSCLVSLLIACYACGRTLPAAQFDSIIAAGTAEAALARESEARAQSEAASLRKEAITAWKQVEERQQALQALEVGLHLSRPTTPCLPCHESRTPVLKRFTRLQPCVCHQLLRKRVPVVFAAEIQIMCAADLQIVQKAAVAENSRLRASLQEWSLANARLERQLQESLQPASVS